ncbi:MAG TPA: hypothetical protein VMH33_08755 [Solirubrobacterales bacterium]|nr:hypothetical protein [Solirubrobacterales bacterium]
MRRPAVGALVLLAVVAAGFVAERIFGPTSVSMGEARQAIEGMPYRVSVGEPSEGVLVGTARTHGDSVVHFAVARSFDARGVPPRLRRVDQNVTGGDGFLVWGDGEVRVDGETGRIERERDEVELAVEEALCRKATGKPCSI